MITSLNSKQATLLDMMWYSKSWTTLKPIEVVISSGLGKKHLVKQIPWSTFQTAILSLIHQAETKARIDEVYQYLERSDSLSEEKYATHRILALEKEIV